MLVKSKLGRQNSESSRAGNRFLLSMLWVYAMYYSMLLEARLQQARTSWRYGNSLLQYVLTIIVDLCRCQSRLQFQISSLALKLVSGAPSKWPDWILFTVTSLSGHGASRDTILEFLSIAAEEVASSDLLASSKFVSTYLTRSCT